MIHASTSMNGKVILVVCMKATVGKHSHPVTILHLTEKDLKVGVNEKSIYDELQSRIQSDGLSMQYIKENLTPLLMLPMEHP